MKASRKQTKNCRRRWSSPPLTRFIDLDWTGWKRNPHHSWHPRLGCSGSYPQCRNYTVPFPTGTIKKHVSKRHLPSVGLNGWSRRWAGSWLVYKPVHFGTIRSCCVFLIASYILLQKMTRALLSYTTLLGLALVMTGNQHYSSCWADSDPTSFHGSQLQFDDKFPWDLSNIPLGIPESVIIAFTLIANNILCDWIERVSK